MGMSAKPIHLMMRLIHFIISEFGFLRYLALLEIWLA